MFKPFFVHYNRNITKNSHGWEKHSPRGFTAYIQPDPNNLRNVLMQLTFCSPKDQFSKKEGRSQVHQTKVEIVNKRDVPKMLAGATSLVENRRLLDSRYYYILKYVV